MVFFRLYESPRYLVHAGRPHDAIKSLQMISKFNGSELSIQLADVRDHHKPLDFEGETNVLHRPRATSTTIVDASVIEDRIEPPLGLVSENNWPGLTIAYSSTGETYNSHDPSAGQALLPVAPNVLKESSGVDTGMEQPLLHNDGGGTTLNPRSDSRVSKRSSIYEEKVYHALPAFIRRPLIAWWDRVMMVLSPEWFTTTVLVWSTWFAMALGAFITSTYHWLTH